MLLAALVGLVQQLRSVPDLPPVRAVSVSSAPEAPARSHGDRCEGLWCGYGELRACCASTFLLSMSIGFAMDSCTLSLVIS